MFAKVAWFGTWFLVASAAFDAVFALVTDIRPIPVPENYLFTLDSGTQRVSLLQLALAVATVMITALGISR